MSITIQHRDGPLKGTEDQSFGDGTKTILIGRQIG